MLRRPHNTTHAAYAVRIKKVGDMMSGGVAAFTEWAAKRIKSRRRAGRTPNY